MRAAPARTLDDDGVALFGATHDPSSRHGIVGDAATAADVASYAYAGLAPEGGVWLPRIAALPGFVATYASSVGLRALAS